MKEDLYTMLMSILLIIPLAFSFIMTVSSLFYLEISGFTLVLGLALLCLCIATYMIWLRQTGRLTTEE